MAALAFEETGEYREPRLNGEQKLLDHYTSRGPSPGQTGKNPKLPGSQP